MPELAELLDPRHTVLVTQECQRGVLGEPAIFPGLADVAREDGLAGQLGRLAVAARAAGVPVVHCVAERRPDGLGSNSNARLFAAAAKAPVALTPGSDATRVIAELGPEPDDLVLSRLHGLGPMYGTDLDPILRNLGVTTIVAVGVSINVGVTDFVMDAVNAGYQVVLPRDAVAGIPRDYATAVIDNTLALLATVTSVADVVAAWATR